MRYWDIGAIVPEAPFGLNTGLPISEDASHDTPESLGSIVFTGKSCKGDGFTPSPERH